MTERIEVTNCQRATRKEKLGSIFEEMLGEQQKAVAEQNNLFSHQEETATKQRVLRKEQHDVQQDILKQQRGRKMPCSPEMARNSAIIQEQTDLGDQQQQVLIKSHQILLEIQQTQKKLDSIRNEMQHLASLVKNSIGDTQQSKQ